MQHAATARRRAVNLSLNESVITEARLYSSNLSATVEALLTDYVEQQHQARAGQQEWAAACSAYWNAVNEKIGSFADEHSTL